MNGEQVNDPEILRRLNEGAEPTTGAAPPPEHDYGTAVTDKEILNKLNAPDVGEQAQIPKRPPRQLSILGPAYGSRLRPEDQEIADRLAARKDFTSSLAKGFTLNWLDEIKAGAEALPMSYARGTPTGFEYRRILNIQREAQRQYENANPVTAGVHEFIGGMINPLSKFLGKYISPIGGAVESRLGGKIAGKVAGTLTEAGLHGAAYGAVGGYGSAENLTPSQLVTTPLEKGLEGAVYGVAGAPIAAGLGALGAYAAEKAGKPILAAAGTAVAPYLPEPLGPHVKNMVEDYAKGKAAQKIASAIEETGKTINEKRMEKGLAPKDPYDLMKEEIVPEASSSLARRGFGADQMEKMVSDMDDAYNKNLGKRVTDGLISQIARDNNVTVKTAKNYYDQFKEKTRVPSNIVEHATNIARKNDVTNAEIPIQELTRISAGAGGAEKSALASELGQRQVEQPARMAAHIDKASGVGLSNTGPQNIDQALDAAKIKTSTLADQLYNKVRENDAPVNVTQQLLKWIGTRNSMTEGPERAALTKVIHMFGSIHQDPMDKLFPIWSPPGQEIKNDVGRFLDARRDLNTIIDSSPPAIARNLNKFRVDMNEAARAQHPGLKGADESFSEGKSIENILDKAMGMAPKVDWNKKDDVSYFDSLTPDQKDLFRIAFGHKLKQIVENSTVNSAFVGGRFMTKGAKDMIIHIFGKEAGTALNENIAKEAATSKTLYRAFGGSQTTPWKEVIEQFRQGAELPANIVTGRVAPALHTLSDMIKYQMAGRYASHIGKMLTGTDPTKNLKTINYLKEAGGQAKRNAAARAAFARQAAGVWSPLIQSSAHPVGMRPTGEGWEGDNVE